MTSSPQYMNNLYKYGFSALQSLGLFTFISMIALPKLATSFVPSVLDSLPIFTITLSSQTNFPLLSFNSALTSQRPLASISHFNKAFLKLSDNSCFTKTSLICSLSLASRYTSLKIPEKRHIS